MNIQMQASHANKETRNGPRRSLSKEIFSKLPLKTGIDPVASTSGIISSFTNKGQRIDKVSWDGKTALTAPDQNLQSTESRKSVSSLA